MKRVLAITFLASAWFFFALPCRAASPSEAAAEKFNAVTPPSEVSDSNIVNSYLDSFVSHFMDLSPDQTREAFHLLSKAHLHALGLISADASRAVYRYIDTSIVPKQKRGWIARRIESVIRNPMRIRDVWIPRAGGVLAGGAAGMILSPWVTGIGSIAGGMLGGLSGYPILGQFMGSFSAALLPPLLVYRSVFKSLRRNLSEEEAKVKENRRKNAKLTKYELLPLARYEAGTAGRFESCKITLRIAGRRALELARSIRR